ncbi:hypothetical protein [Microbacterium sp.]|jgi:hypothetical protein|uniref:hypothetical protein n=1 Tax=Microbacterium sp. TaxID=51671 RepID=UPI003C73D94C
MTEDGHDDEALAATVGVLLKALRLVGRSGDPDAANRLAARAWLALRDGHPRQAELLNGAMHYLARLPQTIDLDSASSPNNQEDQ